MTPHRLAFWLLPALCCAASTLAPLGLWQDGGDKPPETDIYGRPIQRSGTMEDLRQGLLGCWRLVDIDSAEFPAEGRSQSGYLLIAEDFLAIEMHVAWVEDDDELVDDDFQSGIHEYRLEGGQVLVSTSLIGSFLEVDEDENLDLEWEDPGSERSFRVRLNGNHLTLVREDSSSLNFQRVQAKRGSSTDIFGRPRPKKPAEAGPAGREKDG